MEIRRPVEGPFGSEFPAICNHYGVMTAWIRKIWKFCEQFCGYFKMTPYGKIFKILFRKFIWRHWPKLLCANVRFFGHDPRSRDSLRLRGSRNFVVLCPVKTKETISSISRRANFTTLNVVKFVRLRKIDEIVSFVFTGQKTTTKFRLPRKLSLLRGSRPKSAMARPQKIWLTTFQISSKSVHFRRSYSGTREGRSFGL